MTASRVAVPGEGIAENLRNALMVIAGTKALYAKRGYTTFAEQELYADLMAVEYRIQQALTQVEESRPVASQAWLPDTFIERAYQTSASTIVSDLVVLLTAMEASAIRRKRGALTQVEETR